MKSQYLKIAIIAGFIALLLMVLFIRVNAQSAEEIRNKEQTKLLTEMCLDIKYIKNNIIEMKDNNKSLAIQVIAMNTRVTKVEERQIVIKKDIMEVSNRSNWYSGFVASILLLLLTMQIRRNNAHRKNNGKENNCSN